MSKWADLKLIIQKAIIWMKMKQGIKVIRIIFAQKVNVPV